jgi:NAD(P)H-flavin reductase
MSRIEVDKAVIPDPMLPAGYRISRARRENYNTFTLELETAGGGDHFSFAPGQFNMLYAFGVGESAISISGDPAGRGLLIHTIRNVGVVTNAMSRLRRGDMIGVRGPFGNCWPMEEATGRDVIIVAGGIGLAPLRPVIYHILSNRSRYNRVALLYGARTPEDLLYRQELERWRGRFDLEVEGSVDTATSDWRGNVGVVTGLIPRVQFDPSNAIAMLCGPEVMIRFTALELLKHGLGIERIFVSMERNMKCGIGLCGHCQYGPLFVCKDGPVFCYREIQHLIGKREI